MKRGLITAQQTRQNTPGVNPNISLMSLDILAVGGHSRPVENKTKQ